MVKKQVSVFVGELGGFSIQATERVDNHLFILELEEKDVPRLLKRVTKAVNQ